MNKTARARRYVSVARQNNLALAPYSREKFPNTPVDLELMYTS